MWLGFRLRCNHPSDPRSTRILTSDAERFIEEVRDDPKLASYRRIEERELEAGGRN